MRHNHPNWTTFSKTANLVAQELTERDTEKKREVDCSSFSPTFYMTSNWRTGNWLLSSYCIHFMTGFASRQKECHSDRLSRLPPQCCVYVSVLFFHLVLFVAQLLEWSRQIYGNVQIEVGGSEERITENEMNLKPQPDFCRRWRPKFISKWKHVVFGVDSLARGNVTETTETFQCVHLPKSVSFLHRNVQNAFAHFLL